MICGRNRLKWFPTFSWKSLVLKNSVLSLFSRILIRSTLSCMERGSNGLSFRHISIYSSLSNSIFCSADGAAPSLLSRLFESIIWTPHGTPQRWSAQVRSRWRKGLFEADGMPHQPLIFFSWFTSSPSLISSFISSAYRATTFFWIRSPASLVIGRKQLVPIFVG